MLGFPFIQQQFFGSANLGIEALDGLSQTLLLVMGHLR
jgi:hypothetical protein